MPAVDAVRRWLTGPDGRRWLLRALLAYAAVGFVVWIQRPGDFSGYVAVGDLLLSGRDIYLDPAAGMNTWPPFFSLLCVPLALVAAPTPYLARGLWLLVNFACLLLIVHLITRLVYARRLSVRAETPHMSLARPEVLVPLLLTDRYVSGNFDHLQINIVIFALALGGLYLQMTQREIVGSIALGCAAAIKVMPLLFIPYLAYRRRWRPAAYTAVATAGFSLSPVLIFGWHRFWKCVVAWRHRVDVGWGVGKMNQSLYAMWDRFIGHGILPLTMPQSSDLPRSGDPRVLIAVGATLTVIAAISLWVLRGRATNRWATLAEWSVVFIVSALSGPVCWKAYLMVLLLPVTLLFAVWRCPDVDVRRRRAAGVVLLASVFLGGFTSPGIIGKGPANALDITSVSTLGALMFLGAALWLRAWLGNEPPLQAGTST